MRRATMNRTRREPRDLEPIANGARILDTRLHRSGTITDHACQYAHPKADPVYNYLIAWEDGQVQALSEFAFRNGHGLQILD